MKRLCVYPNVWIYSFGLLLVLSPLASMPGVAQDAPRVTLSMQDVPLRDVLQALERQTAVRFAYLDTLVAPHTVTVEARATPWTQVLDTVLPPLGIAWTQVGGNVVLQAAAAPPLVRRTWRGVVVDGQTGAPLPLAAVLVPALDRAAVTTSDGRFELPDLPPGPHDIRVRYLGYATLRAMLPADATRAVRFALTPEAVTPGALVVTADVLPQYQRSDTAALAILEPEALERLPAVGEPDALRALLTVPGINLSHDASVGLFIRGGTPDQHLIRLDGMTLYHIDHLFGFFSPFNPDALHTVALYKGGFPATYGERTASVIDLTGYPRLNASRPEASRLRLRVGLLSASAAVRGPLAPKLDGALAVRRAFTDLWTTPLTTTLIDATTGQDIDDDLQGRRFAFGDLHAAVRWRRTATDQWALHAFASDDRYQQERGDDEAFEPEVFRQRLASRWNTRAASVRWKRQWSASVASQLTGTLSRYRTRYDNTLLENGDIDFERNVNNRVQEAAVRLNTSITLTDQHRLDIGASHTDVRILFREDEPEGVTREDEREALSAAYLQDTWTPHAAVTLTAGVRVTHSADQERIYVSPRAAGTWRLGMWWRLQASAGQYHQWMGRIVNENVLEGPRDVWTFLPDEARSRHIGIGAHLQGASRTASVEVYRQAMDGVALFSERFADDPNLFDFFGTGTAFGVESSLSQRVGSVDLRLAYTHNRVRYRFDALDGGADFPALHDRPHAVKATLEATRGAFLLTLFGVVRSGRPVTPVAGAFLLEGPDGEAVLGLQPGARNSDRLPAYQRLDVSLHHRARVGTARWTTTLALFNVLNRRNAWYRQVEIVDDRAAERTVAMLGFLPSVTIRLDLP
ncbi:MAG: TonB-dependent receptor [Bacteroidota bacterium]